mmetsp:Transcript_98199/g.306269  ORF Transcript_98199/g.306269 Transcript_98199/m.306269 type:complete len:203 (+) Transcript_98199:970-1578(+)
MCAKQGIVATRHGVELADGTVGVARHLAHEGGVGGQAHGLLQDLWIVQEACNLRPLLHQATELGVHAQHRAHGLGVAHHLLHHWRAHELLHHLWVLHHLVGLRHHLLEGIPSCGCWRRCRHRRCSPLCWLRCGCRTRRVVQAVDDGAILRLVGADGRHILPDAAGAYESNIGLGQPHTFSDLLLQLANRHRKLRLQLELSWV